MKSMNSTSPRIPQLLPRIARFEKLTYGLFVHFDLQSQLNQGEWIRCLGKQPPATEALPLTLNAAGAAGWKLIKHLELSHADPLAKNSATEPNNVAPKPAPAQAKLADGAWFAVLPPASWHVLRFSSKTTSC
jgi:hypothetical protein